MTKNLRQRWSILVLFVLSFVLMFLLMDRRLSIYDEGIPLTGGMLSSEGWMAYRDFYANYGPAQFKIVGWLVKCFGPRLEVIRFYDLAVRAGIVVALFALLRGVTGFWPAIAAWASSLVWLACDGSSGYPAYPALLMMLMSSDILLKGLVRPGSRDIFFFAGVMAGLCGLFRFDAGAVLVSTHVISLFYFSVVQVSGQKIQDRRNGWEKILVYCAGAALVVFPVLLFYAANGSLLRLWHDTVYFPSRNYVRTRSLPFIGLQALDGLLGTRHLMIYFPLLTLFLAFLVAWTGKIPRVTGKAMLLLIGLVVPLTAKGMVRLSIIHLQPAIVLSIGILALYWVHFRLSLPRAIKTCLTLVTLFLFTASSDMLIARITETRFVVLRDIPGFIAAWQENRVVGAMDSVGQRENPSMFFVETERLNALEIMRRCAGKTDRIYLGRNPHHRIFANDVISYFLLARKPATHWYHFDPGLQTQQSIQAEMIRDLETTKPPWIWLDTEWNNINEPNDSALSSGVTLLDDYIEGSYQGLIDAGPIKILHRKGVVPPAGCPS